jgi:surface polysaccharide O-acyltransferase-like enzyme
LPNKTSIDTLRGLACFLLVAYHVVGFSPAAGLELPAQHWASRLDDWLSLVRMPLFSLLSGWVYAQRPVRGWTASFARGKVRRLLVPMLLVGTAFAVLQAFTPGVNAPAPDWRLLHIRPVGHYWFLEALFWIFLATMLLEQFRLLERPLTFAMVGAVVVGVHVTSPLPVYLGLEGAVTLLPFFLLGVAAARFPGALLRPRVVIPFALLSVVAMADLATIPELRLAEIQTFPKLLASVGMCLLLLYLQPRHRWLAWVGRWSFGIYLFHAMFTAAARIALYQLGVVELPVLFALALVAGVAGPIVLTALLREVPGGHWLIGERPKRRADIAEIGTAT